MMERSKPSRLVGCPDVESMTRASCEGPDLALRAHLRECMRCRSEWEQACLIRELGQLLPTDRPDPEQRQRVRAALVDRVDESRRPLAPARRWILIAVGAVGAVAGVGIMIALQGSEPGSVAEVSHPSEPTPAVPLRPSRIDVDPSTRFFVAAGPPHEVVKLYHGTLRVTVERAEGVNRSFRVVAPDGEVEVRGTVFETTVLGGHLTGVRVERGGVVLKPRDAPAVVLPAGKQWQAPIQPDHLAPAPTRADAAPAAHTRASRASGSPAERAFDEGLRALGRSDSAEAARAFERASVLAGDGAIAEEASYWRAFAFSRAGEESVARDGLGAFLARFPRSARAGEASVMLGWLLLGSGDRLGAEARFRVGLRDASTRVQAGAREGLAATDQDRNQNYRPAR